MQSNKKILLKIDNLKQYFPLKKRGLFVKANDGITLDIFEDETFGLVGESGCGKSTMGRTLLQLYQQTDGRTMYYGRSLDDIAPRYVKNTLVNLEKRRDEWKHIKKQRNTLGEELIKLVGTDIDLDVAGDYSIDVEENHPEIKRIYTLINDYRRLNKETKDAYLDIVTIIGGFIVAENYEPVKAAFLKVYNLSVELVELKERHRATNIDVEALEYREAKTGGKKSAIAAARKRLAAIQKDIDAKQKELDSAHAAIQKMREAYAGNDEFAKAEEHLDKGIDLARLRYEEMRMLRSDMQLIFQDPYSSLNPRMTVGQIIGEGLTAHGKFTKSDDRMQDYILSVMEKCGLAPYMLHRYPHQFSGGQRQRIGIARSLALGPRFVVCDEAVSALDVSIQSQILNLLLDLKNEGHLTYLFISHDLSVVKYISDRIGVMYLGNMVELATTDELFNNTQHPYTEALLNAIPTTDPDSKLGENLLEGDIPSPINPPKGCKFHTRCKYATEACSEVEPVFEEVSPGHYVACHHKLGERK